MMIKRTTLIRGLSIAALLWPTLLFGQLIDPHSVTGAVDPLGQRVIDTSGDISGRLDEAARLAQKEALVAQALARDAALDPITRALSNPLAQLPNALPIIDLAGQLAHVEVIVEDGWRAVAREWLAWVPADQQQSLSALPGITVLSVDAMAGLGMALVRFQVSEDLDSYSALLQRLPESLHANLDRNHLFNSQVQQPAQGDIDIKSPASETSSSAPSSACEVPTRVGMVDTQVQISHPAFAKANIKSQSFLPAQLTQPAAHGTAVAGLLVGQGEGLQAPLPRGELFAASAFYARSDYSEGATTQSLLRALNWLATEKVNVINLSLAGPPNQLLALAVTQLAAKDIGLVAAVGNEGPAAPALYPAAYEQVVGVTAVDSDRAIYRWANQGEQVAFAAMGVSVLTARAQTDPGQASFGRETGTSMAAPIIAAHMACTLAQGFSVAESVAQLREQALDLGELGLDSIFGAGLIP